MSPVAGIWYSTGVDTAGQSDLDAVVMQMGVVWKKKTVHQMDQNHG